MTNKNRNRRQAVAVKQPKQKKPAKPTPFSDAGAIVGSKLGTMFNVPYLKGVGKWLGSGIGQIFGSGDYQIVGSIPEYNVMMNGNQIPKFSTSKQTNIICHREYLGDVLGTAGFNNTLYPLNPGIATTFPWLSTIAQNYQQYKFHGIIFEFRPLITDFVTNGAPGVVVMATNYNADASAYNTKQEMENSEYAVSVKPTRELMHGIECATTQTTIPQLYVRTGSVPVGQDLRLYDLGSFQFATQVNPIQNLGELWVSYCIEFFKPILPADVGGNVLSFWTSRSGATGAVPLGTTAVSGPLGDLNATVNSTTITFPAQPANAYFVSVTWKGAAALAISPPVTTLTGLKVTSNLFGGTDNPFFAPGGAVVSDRLVVEFIVTSTILVPGLVSVAFGVAGAVPIGTVSVVVTAYSSEAVVP
jgi:hypothetical protein